MGDKTFAAPDGVGAKNECRTPLAECPYGYLY